MVPERPEWIHQVEGFGHLHRKGAVGFIVFLFVPLCLCVFFFFVFFVWTVIEGVAWVGIKRK